MKKILLVILFISSVQLYAQDLFSQTLKQDIESARYYDLVTWCKNLGLNTSGNIATLRTSLYKFYNITKSEETRTGDMEILIESADLTEYFTIKDIEENYLRLTGSVHLRVIDNDSKDVHVIKSQEIFYNQSQELVFALGNVNYQLIQGKDEENFHGERLFFNLKNWEGVFLDGGSESTEKNESGEELTFFYQAEEIKRSRDEVIILSDVDRSSSNYEEPYYKIKASKVWILNSDEWAILNAVLYIGEIPIFYFPFYFNPSDEMFFNPVMGTDSEKGAFLNNTIYIYGQKESSDGSFSFLSVSTSVDDNSSDSEKGKVKETERHGLYLLETDKVLPADDPRQKYELKWMMDAYSNLGFFTGLEGDFDRGSSKISTDFLFGLGFSWKQNSSSQYPGPLLPERSFGENLEWEEGYFINTKLPFRYLSEWDATYKNHTFRANLGSDSDIKTDFLERKENLDYLSLTGFEATEIEDTSQGTFSAWDIQFKGSYSPKITFLGSFLTSISTTYTVFDMDWALKPATATESDFFYPSGLIFPSVGLTMGGTLFPFTLPSRQGKETDELLDLPIKAPWQEDTPVPSQEEEKAASEEEEPISESGLILPLYRTDAPAVSTDIGSFFPSLTYSLSANAILNNAYYSGMTEPEEINFDQTFSKAQYSLSRLDFILKLPFGIWGSMTNTLNLQANEQYHYFLNEDDTILSSADRDAKEQSDKSQSQRQGKGDVTVTLNPFTNSVPLTVNYGWSGLLFRKDFDAEAYALGSSDYYDWTTYEITDELTYKHSLSLDYKPNLFGTPVKGYFGYTRILPPEEVKDTVDTSLTYISTYLDATVGQNISREEGEDWVPDPISLDLGFKDGKSEIVSALMNYDWELSELSKIKLGMIYGVFSAEYLIEQTTPYYLDDAWLWQQGYKDDSYVEGDTDLLPQHLKFNIAPKVIDHYWWKNRIGLSVQPSFNWDIKLIKFTETNMSFSLDSTLNIHEFLDIKFSSVSSNESSYKYIPAFVDRINEATDARQVEWLNPVDDILGGFNFFNDEERQLSSFKLDSLSLGIVHYMPDWVLSFTLDSSPQSVEDTSGVTFFEWNTTFTIELRWKPIEKINTEIERDSDKFEVKTAN